MKRISMILSLVTAVLLFNFTVASAHEGHDHSDDMGMSDDITAFPGKSELTPERDKALGEVIHAYLQIRKALSKDSLDGISETAGEMADIADDASSKIKAMKTAHSKYTHKLHSFLDKLVRHADKLKGNDIGKVRKQFLMLSEDVFNLVKIYGKPKSVKADSLYGYYCTMFPGYWVQENNDVGNPFYGSKMLKCAEPVGDTSTKIKFYVKRKRSKHKKMKMKMDMKDMNHMDHDHEHHM